MDDVIFHIGSPLFGLFAKFSSKLPYRKGDTKKKFCDN